MEYILPELFDEILVPEAVWKEILAGGETDAAKQKIPFISWIDRIPAISVSPEIEDYNLGKGETEALSLALEMPSAGVILDDFAARKCARDLKVSFIGTGGLLISAKQKNLISSVSEALEKVQNEGLWLSGAVIEMLKEKAGE